MSKGSLTPILIDLGLTKILGEENKIYIRRTSVDPKTHSAAERIDGTSGFPGDIWALGITFFEFFEGRTPLDQYKTVDIPKKYITLVGTGNLYKTPKSIPNVLIQRKCRQEVNPTGKIRKLNERYTKELKMTTSNVVTNLDCSE
eukprot:TRINITY_DN9355_c0_g1_i1.p1 TRINITY_DN9355_c0_g1~~TRINITY_DN9355_c0_g1_i1.p1  ORF type:complete len:144 (+),score=10.36 TRINITY_DN9355_c0_g1_i1:404-835(+)